MIEYKKINGFNVKNGTQVWFPDKIFIIGNFNQLYKYICVQDWFYKKLVFV